MEQLKRYGVPVERGSVVSEIEGCYTVASLDRDGIVTPPLPVLGNIFFQPGQIVYFALFRDGTGLIYGAPLDGGGIPFPYDDLTEEQLTRLYVGVAKAMKDLYWERLDAFRINDTGHFVTDSGIDADRRHLRLSLDANGHLVGEYDGLIRMEETEITEGHLFVTYSDADESVELELVHLRTQVAGLETRVEALESRNPA